MIFSNVLDIYDFTAKLLSSVEDQVEMAQDEVPLVGTCFTDLTEVKERVINLSFSEMKENFLPKRIDHQMKIVLNNFSLLFNYVFVEYFCIIGWTQLSTS